MIRKSPDSTVRCHDGHHRVGTIFFSNIKIAEKYLQNLESSSKNDLDHESKVPMSFNLTGFSC